jgi:O-antigen chain-terminating methyltransferase
MLEHNNPAIDVDDLMARIQQEVAKRGVGYEPVTFTGDPSAPLPLASIEALLNTAQAKAEIRTRWSGQLRIFPFDRSPKLQRLALRGLAYLFKDQRHVNFALIASLRESLAVNRGLLRRLILLETEVQRLQADLRETELRK